MHNPATRMSPLTAFFLGLFGCGAVGIVAVAVILLSTLHLADRNVESVLHFAKGTIEGLPEIMQSLPPALADAIHDRRDPQYVSSISAEARLVDDPRGDGVRPVLSITNNGDRVVSLLAVRVAALNDRGVPVRDWTEVVATPLAIDESWRGPLMPHETRHIAVRRGSIRGLTADSLKADVEISDVRVWEPSENASDATRRASIADRS